MNALQKGYQKIGHLAICHIKGGETEIEEEKGGRKSRRAFLWQLGVGLVGFTGLSRLAEAMTFPQPLAIPRCSNPTIPVECDSEQPFNCDQA